ncbi:MAG: site-2 protease family protein [Candidatus Woesearchaeota archaeon]
MLDWFLNYWGVILFYLVVSFIVYFNRKKFEFEGIVALYRTKLGIKAMKAFVKPVSEKKQKIGIYLYNVGLYLAAIFSIIFIYTNFVTGLENLSIASFFLIGLGTLLICISLIWFGQLEKASILGIWVGFLGMLIIIAMVIFGIIQLFIPEAPPLFTPVIPGFQIPGGPRIPLVQGLLALFIVVVVHEFAHGVVSKLHKIKIKSSGFAMLGPIPAAFVEPDQKKLEKAPRKIQMAMYAAGPFSNVLLAILIAMVINVFAIIALTTYAPSGLIINEANNTLATGDILTQVNGHEIRTIRDLQVLMQNTTPGQTLEVGLLGEQKQVTLMQNPLNESRGYLGVVIEQRITSQNNFMETIKPVYFWIFGNPYGTGFDTSLGLMGWIFALSLGIGLVNLLPIGPVDGGRMFYLTLTKYLKEKTALQIWTKTSIILVIVLVLLIFVPIIRNLFNI